MINNLVAAVKQLKQRYPSMYLSMAPEHPYVQGGFVAYSGIWGAYLPMIDQLRNELDLLHVQLYNNGGLSTPYRGQAYPAGSVDMMVSSALMLMEGFPLAGGDFPPKRFLGLQQRVELLLQVAEGLFLFRHIRIEG